MTDLPDLKALRLAATSRAGEIPTTYTTPVPIWPESITGSQVIGFALRMT